MGKKDIYHFLYYGLVLLAIVVTLIAIISNDILYIVKGINYLFFASSLLLINVYNHQGVIIKILCCISIVLIIVLDFLPLK